MDTTAKRSLEFLLGPLMATVVAAAALVVVAASPLNKFPEIQRACFITHLVDPDCKAGALTAGISTLVAFALVLITTTWAMRRVKAGAPTPLSIPPWLTMLFLAFCVVLTVAHLISRELAPPHSSRIDDLSGFSTFISIENLLWPFAVQLLLLEKDARIRSAIVSVLMLIMILTPYRAVSLAIFLFGFLLPLAYLLLDAYWEAWPKKTLWVIANRTILVALVGGAVFWNGAVDSQTRAISATPLTPIRQPGGFEMPPVELGTIGRLQQRIAFPLYQAAIVSHLSRTTTLPTAIDELKRKFRMDDRPNLNEFAYKAIYPGGITFGQTTSLYYGEGAAYFGKAGLLWVVGAPLFFVPAWLLFIRRRLEISAILSIALWRSSFAGLITILPALLFQLSGMFVMSRFGRFPSFLWLKTPIVTRFATGCLLTAVLTAAAAQAWASIHDPQRRDMLRLEFAAKSGCTFDVANIESLPDRVDRVLTVPGRTVSSSLTFYTPELVYLVLPYGKVLQLHLSEFIAPVSHFIDCTRVNEPSPVEISDIRTVSSLGVIPLDLFTLISTIITGFLLTRGLTGRIFLPPFTRQRFVK